jgi:hypothetical protein
MTTTQPAGNNLIAELDLLQLGPGERPWKLYCFRPAAGRATHLEHRIYTKLKAGDDRRLLSFPRSRCKIALPLLTEGIESLVR